MIRYFAAFAAILSIPVALALPAKAVTSSTGAPVLTNVALHETDVMQSFARFGDGSWLFAQVSNTEYGYTQTQNQARGDLTLTHVSTAGKAVSVMYLRNFGHGISIGIDRGAGGPWVWVEAKLPVYPAPDNNGYGIKIARFKWAPGTTIWPASTGVQLFDPVPGADHVTPSVDAADGLVAVRYHDSNGAHINVYSLAVFITGVFFPLATYDEISHPATLQGWSLMPGGNSFALLTGDATSSTNPPPGNTELTIWDSSGITGQELLTDIPDASSREPEGVNPFVISGQIVTGWATGTAGAKLANLFSR